MKLQNVPVDDIVASPWRDTDLYPIDEEHIRELRESIHDHEFFSSLKGRRVNGKVEIACGHARLAAAREEKLATIPIFVADLADLDDDAMLRLMVDENALQQGVTSPGAVLNEVAAITQRLVGGLLAGSNGPVASSILDAFENKRAVEVAQGRLTTKRNRSPFGEDSICRYLGQGKPERSHRSLRQIRESINALKQSGRWDKIIDTEILKYPQAVGDAEPAEDTAINTTKSPESRKPLIDERVANVFKTEMQFHAFREAVTTRAAQKAIPFKQQVALAKQIMSSKLDRPNQITTTYIIGQVKNRVRDYMKAQRQLSKAERDAYLAEQIEVEIDHELHNAGRSVRSLIGSIMKLEKLAVKYPRHPKLGGFSAKLDELVDSIKQFSRKLK